jgi:PGF-CTERM protein
MRARETLTALALATLLLIGSAGPITASHGAQPSFAVDLQADGDATVTITCTYDLDDDSEQTAFEKLQTNDSATAALEQRFQNRLATITENRTGREMSVQSASATRTSESSTGIVELSVQWRGLAATTDDGLVVSEPFASGFEPNRQFTLVMPDGYEVSSTAPAADETGDGQLTLASGTALDGFEVVVQQSPDATASGGDDSEATTDSVEPDATSSDGPAFGVVAALAALLTGAGLAVRRQ